MYLKHTFFGNTGQISLKHAEKCCMIKVLQVFVRGWTDGVCK